MPPKKSLQQQHEEQLEAMREMFTEFQRGMRDVLRDSVETAVRTLIQVQQRPPGLPQRAEQSDEEDEEDDVANNNPFAERGEQRQLQGVIVAPRGDDNRWESGFRVDLPEFSGSLQPDELLDWISSVEEILEFKRVPDNMCVALVATRFKGRASAWWQQVKEQRARAGKERIQTWEKLKRHLRKAFLPYNYSRTLYTRFQNLRQGTKSVDEYASEFFSLLARNTLTETEEQVVSRFIGGLKLQIQNSLLQFA